MKMIIFDFNRTLYDPDEDALLPNVFDVLALLSRRKYLLYLVSRNEGGREDLVTKLGLDAFFQTVLFVDAKTPEIFTNLITSVTNSTRDVYMVGDYRHEDVRFGNLAGAKTIWLRRGKFATQEMEVPEDKPWATIRELKYLLDILS